MWLQRRIYIPVKETIIVQNTSLQEAAQNNTDKNAVFKNFTPFLNCISQVNNTQLDNAHDIDIFMPIHSLIEYRTINMIILWRWSSFK